METRNTKIERKVFDINTIVVMPSGKEFTMCGEVVNGVVKMDSVDIVFWQKENFELMNETVQESVKETAYAEFKRYNSH